MGLYVSVQRVADDGKVATYSFTTLDGPERTLFVDREEERIWPEDGNSDGIFRGAVHALVRSWRKHGELPDKALQQS